MFLGKKRIDDWLTFSCNTHNPTNNAAATDADSVPTYRIYEDETGAAMSGYDPGNMAKLDDTNTTGFYSERIQLTAANGFESNKTYTIYISAAVNAITGTISHNFHIEGK